MVYITMLDSAYTIELHGDELEKIVKKGLRGAKQKFADRMNHTFERGVLSQQCLGVVMTLDKKKYWLSSSYKRDASNRLKDKLPAIKAADIREIVAESKDEVANLLRQIASQSLTSGMKDAMDAFAQQAANEFKSTFWGIIGAFFAGLAEVVTFGLYNNWDNIEANIVSGVVGKIQSHGVVDVCVAKFAEAIASKEEAIITYVRTKVVTMSEESQKIKVCEADAAPDAPSLIIEEIEEEDYKACKFRPFSGILWCDPNIDNKENSMYCKQLEGTYGKQFHACKKPEEAESDVGDNPLTRFTVITAGTNGQDVAKRCQDKINVDRLLVFCMNKMFHESWAKELPKRLGATVHTDITSVVTELAKSPDRPLETFLRRVDIERRLVECMRVSQHSQVQDLADDLDTEECARQLLQADGQSTNDKQATEWKQILESSDSTETMVLWSGNTFCYPLTRQMRKRQHDTQLLCCCRLAQIMSEHHTRLGHDSKFAFRGNVFRGLNIKDQAVFKQYADSKGTCVFFREFMATSREEHIATSFAGSGGGDYKVILRIDAVSFPTYLPCPLRIDEWSNYKGEAEVLFPLLSGFEVCDVSVSGKTATVDLKFVFAVPDPTAAFIYAFL